MWLAVERVLREARLVEPRLGRDFWSQAVARLFFWWPQIFSEVENWGERGGTESLGPTALGTVLEPYGEIGGDFMAVIVSLREAGLATSTLDGAVHHIGKDLLRMIRLFVATARRLDDCRVWNSDWVAALRRIEVELVCERQGSR